ncbi:ornithine carbamoyltransferase [Metschnikowia bicuspidata var. bicuspidata NRRL YB-4993]|uniref:ornithine carbamoyltransferase n=1 Tax=Metschnikowia bicuspidata var. bicuspidata NRRL YB-4993 TaxID=869754 RepID=A0A1A0H8M1_9ASCO|nr:ornithine carbamoyltransferase [Metschnikowia bicuspidata var. bicuspidata NRRL YB-4993]OBA20464.1 ornithine carbamoyltransferase [Metschnikowia bicuspidata var. bicuspidata NRRL YB-4993]
MFKRYFSSSMAMKSTTPINTTPRHLVSISQLSAEEFSALVTKAQHFKNVVRSGDSAEIKKNHDKLLGKLVALLFSKRSTRTRISSEGAAAHFGAQPMFLGKDDIQLGVNESMYDTTKVISLMTSCVFARVNKHLEIQELCKHSSVPIINSLCDMYHPLQAIADVLSIKEAFGKTQGLKLAWIGDANNVINDLAIAALKVGISVSVLVPASVTFEPSIVGEAEKIVSESSGAVSFEVVNEPLKALKDANVIVTDTWISMGQESEKAEKLKQFAGYQITQQMLHDGQVNENWKFMHCLPRHAEEVADDVFYCDNSIVFEEAENRLYAAMAVIEAFVVNKGDLLK